MSFYNHYCTRLVRGFLLTSTIWVQLIDITPIWSNGEEMSGTITNGDNDVDGWKSKAYKVDVSKGVEYFIRLTHDDSETVAL